MNKVILAAALICISLSMYYFFLVKNLFLGSITIILAVVFNLMYAMMNTVNKIDPKGKK
jgi:hypothetical protein